MLKPTITSILCLIVILISSFSCGSDEGGDDGGTPEPSIAVASLVITDLNNNANASDFRVSFDVSVNEGFVQEYRAIITKQSAISNLSLASIEALPASSYFRISKTGGNISTNLNAGLLDVEGNEIVEGETYSVFVLAIGDGTNVTANKLSNQSNPVTLENADVLEIMAELPIGTGGLEVDSEGNIYCADFGQSLGSPPGTLVYKITPEGEASVFANGLVGASGNTFNADGSLLYQSNIQGGSVSTINSSGQVSPFVSGMSSPVGVVFDNAGNLYVANCGDNTVKKVTPGGEVSVFASGNLFACPNGITIDNDGNLYVANFSSANVVKIDPQGTSSVLVGFPGGNNGHLTFYQDNLYVVARASNQVYKVDLDGNSELIVGSGNRGHQEGNALQGGLSLPNDLEFSPDGQFLYINDSKPLTGTPANSDIKPTYLKRVRFKRQ
ncbi:SMP-30/gluconolactonase/LRE family protein [Roseivirga sp. E12]|uniref:SMP-30/gluconolactonase/LRE family protein n=1 Tax=Roseivirga sp. E12 TaxID=2819237 RepID=UPI001ABC0B75|nr:SMP-30/gluconolactonase/LRE family protein [Roseivirga sp. E12]MBO3699885.1 SMP-30/gluconolactonase/LRE family protein [Roseivirga sp. E12]